MLKVLQENNYFVKYNYKSNDKTSVGAPKENENAKIKSKIQKVGKDSYSLKIHDASAAEEMAI